jgi:XTP/dITP diphosphohydrolase
MKLVFVTNNIHKLKEAKAIIEGNVEVVSLAELGCTDEIAETCDTIEGNASQKAFYISNKFGVDCFADDTGLEIEALDGRPGVYAARYAGEGCSFDDNINKVLCEMQMATNRKACFRTIVSLIINGMEVQFEGRVNGLILWERQGKDGFGYDPIFQPEGYELSFAEMPLSEKNLISHRGRALQKMMEYLKGSMFKV